MWNQRKFRYSLKMLLLMSLFGVAAATSLVSSETVVDAADTVVVINAADVAGQVALSILDDSLQLTNILQHSTHNEMKTTFNKKKYTCC